MASDSPPFIASTLSISPTGLLTLAESSNPATDSRGPQREGWECFPWEKFKGFVINERSNRSGWTWEHGFDVKRHNNSSHWICWHCVTRRSPQPAIFAAAGTANQAKHLVNEHGVHDPTGKRPAKRAKVSIAERLHMDVTKPAEQAVVNRLIQSFNPTYFQELLVDWITHDNVPFRKVESHHSRRLMEYTNPACASSLPSHPTVRKWLLNEFNRHRGIVTELLHGSLGLIHLSFDGWTSRNHKSLLGVIVHFLSSNGKLRQFTIGLPQLEGHHGVDMAEEVAQIIADWGIGNKIGYFITDNAFNNDTAIDQLADEFGFDAKQRRLRCIGHIINLVVRQILFGVDFDLFEQDCHDARDLFAEHRHWRQKGALGKLHNVIHAIARSESLRAKLRRLQQAGQPAGEGDAVTYELVLDNATRWNSFEAMIERSIKLRYFIDAILLNEVSEWKAYILRARADGREIKRKQPVLVDDYLTADDWATINEYHSILQPFKEVTIRLQDNPTQGQFGALWEVLPVMEFLLGHLEEVKDRNDVYPEEHFKINVELGWAKLNEYYTLLDDTPAYVAALVLHPAFRWTWIEKHWADRPEWIASAKTSVNQLWKGQYQLTQATDEASDERPLRRIRDETTSFASWLQSSTAKPLIPTTSDEYTTWQTDTSPLDTEQRNPIEYWLLRQKQYPRLSRMALDLFSIPAMSTEVERIFSLAGQMITPLRSRLEGNTIAVAQILRSWVGAGIIKR